MLVPLFAHGIVDNYSGRESSLDGRHARLVTSSASILFTSNGLPVNQDIKTDAYSEYQLFSNIAAMVVSGLTAKKDLRKAEQRRTLMEIGLRACLLIRGMADSVTAGVMNKTCTFLAQLPDRRTVPRNQR